MARNKAGEKLYEVTIQGVSPLLMNANSVFITPEKRNRTAEEKIERARNEWRQKAYFSENVGVYIPSDYVERCVQVAAGKWKLGKRVAATVFSPEQQFPVTVSGVERFTSLDDFKKHGWIDERNVRMNGKQSVGRSRPRLPFGWKATFTLSVLTDEITGDLLKDMIVYGGMFVGIGDWRPKFGRFDVVSFKEVFG